MRELTLIAALFLAYKAGRVVADGHVTRAFVNAHRIWYLERTAHLPSEVTVQHALLASDVFIRSANIYYATVHFIASAAFLLWIYLRRPSHYVWIRNLMAATTALALAVHLAFPLAPPRMLHDVGLIDTASRYGPSVYGPPTTDTLSNQYAAMPSLHVGWALIVAVGMVYSTRGRWRWLWLAYPATTTAVVIGTANHYWLDCAAGTAIVFAVLPLARRFAPSPRPAAQGLVPAQPGEHEPRPIPAGAEVGCSGGVLPLREMIPGPAAAKPSGADRLVRTAEMADKRL